MMNFLELAKKRYSVRKYTSQKVEKEKLDMILEAGRVAPSGHNNQPQRLIVVQEKEGLDKIGKAANIYNAPLAIIVCGNAGEAWVRSHDGKVITDIDASIVTDHMMLQATELGLGSLWICFFRPDVIRNEFALPGEIVPVNILAIGYADDEPKAPNRHSSTRKALHETVFYEKL